MSPRWAPIAASAPEPPPRGRRPRFQRRCAAASSPAVGGAAHSARPHISPRPARDRGVAGGARWSPRSGWARRRWSTRPRPTPSTQTTAEHITVSTPPMAIPLSQASRSSACSTAPRLTARSADPQRRASCLSGLGYPASTPGAGRPPVEINARPGVVLVLPGDTPGNLTRLRGGAELQRGRHRPAGQHPGFRAPRPRLAGVARHCGNSTAYAGVHTALKRLEVLERLA